MANFSAAVMAAIRRKLNITWESDETESRIADVVTAISPRLASLVGLPQDHEFTEADGAAWGLFLSGCLYEFSDAWDDFERNYADQIASVRLMVLAAGGEADA